MGDRHSAVIIATIAVVLGVVLVWGFRQSPEEQAARAPIAEITDTSTIQQTIQLSHLSIATSENFVGHKIQVIEATMKNVSEKPIRMAEVKMVFTDQDGNSVQEYSERVLGINDKPLEPGREFRFEMRQENLPKNWNYRVPITQVTKIGL